MTPEKREAAGIVRRAVWRDGRCPPSPDRYPWSMARELHAWQRIVDMGTDPQELNAALGLLRSVYPRALRVTCLLHVPGLLADVLLEARARRSTWRRGGSELAQITFGFGARAPRSYVDYCGPAVVASVLGITRRQAAARLLAVQPPLDGATSVHAVEVVLGTRAYAWPRRPGPTLKRFLSRAPAERVVFVGRREPHWVHVAPGRIIEDNGTHNPRSCVEWVVPCPTRRRGR